jgi:hypothetical protein
MAWGAATIAAVVAAVAAVVGAGVAAYSSYQQGEATGKINAYNMEIRRREAETKRLIAERNIDTQKRKNEADLARQRLSFGLSGVDPTTGSPIDVMLQTKEEMAYTEAYMGWQRDVGADTAVTDLVSMKYQGDSAQRGAYTQGVGNLLSGVSKAGSIYADYSRANSGVSVSLKD